VIMIVRRLKLTQGGERCEGLRAQHFHAGVPPRRRRGRGRRGGRGRRSSSGGRITLIALLGRSLLCGSLRALAQCGERGPDLIAHRRPVGARTRITVLCQRRGRFAQQQRNETKRGVVRGRVRRGKGGVKDEQRCECAQKVGGEREWGGRGAG
jgi:hypothetical protein